MADEIFIYQLVCTLIMLAAAAGIVFGMGKAPSYEEQKRRLKESDS